MQKISKYFLVASAALIMAPSLFSCASNISADQYCLRVLNSEDYINPEILTNFQDEMSEKHGHNVRVIYDTFDTMENMYNVLNTGKTKYDLICASDYMIQKLANNGLIQELDHSKVPYYDNETTPVEGYDEADYDPNDVFASEFIRSQLLNDTWELPNDIDNYKKGDVVNLDQYCECYMWGTLGILYNPDRLGEDNHDKFVKDMTTFHSLWDSTYNKLIAIKDSMRDTYAIGLIERYRDEFDATDSIGDPVERKKARQKIFDRGGENDKDENNNSLAPQHINEVKDKLIELRNNIFGFEVDSGKQDIVTGKIAIDTAWSGDAVWAIDEAAIAQEGDSSVPDLYYSVPEEGSNIWFDCWAMQKDAKKDLAYDFLNYLSRPDNVALNYDEIGYTSAIAGEDVYDMYVDAYEEFEIEVDDVADYATLSGAIGDYEVGDVVQVDADESRNSENNCYELIEEDGVKKWDFIRILTADYDTLSRSASSFEEGDSAVVYADEDHESETTYYEYDGESWEFVGYEKTVDLLYFFDDSNLNTNIAGFPINVISDELSDRELSAQFPDENVIDNLMIMRDYGANNELITKMWEEVKHERLPDWAIALFVIEIVLIGGGIVYLIIYKARDKSRRKMRRQKTA